MEGGAKVVFFGVRVQQKIYIINVYIGSEGNKTGSYEQSPKWKSTLHTREKLENE